ncbi:MAG TPA: hypothetical protein VFS45_04605 [Sphingomicrobium sp.]|nr:hypothetical protein [Sphingomicrobium sp.]
MEGRLTLFLAALAQAVASVPPERIDLTRSCEARAATDQEIVVCGRRGEGPGPYRIAQMPPERASIPKAEVQVADGVRIAGETETVDVGGFPSQRFVLRLKLAF